MSLKVMRRKRTSRRVEKSEIEGNGSEKCQKEKLYIDRFFLDFLG